MGFTADAANRGTLVSQRLRVNEKLRRTLEAYQQACAEEHSEHSQPVRVGEIELGPTAGAEELREQPSLAQSIAEEHDRSEIGLLAPADLVPGIFLSAIIITPDPAVRTDDRLRARRMLTKRTKNLPLTCMCPWQLRARNYLQLKEWIATAVEAGVEPETDDPMTATLVRRIADDDKILPWADFSQTRQAVGDVLRHGVERARGARAAHPPTKEQDPTVRPFWRLALARDSGVTASDRLKAFAALDVEGVLPRCTCTPSQQTEYDRDRIDAWRAFIIRMVTKETNTAAFMIARYPETYLAVRDAIDRKLIDAIGEPAQDNFAPETVR